MFSPHSVSYAARVPKTQTAVHTTLSNNVKYIETEEERDWDNPKQMTVSPPEKIYYTASSVSI